MSAWGCVTLRATGRSISGSGPDWCCCGPLSSLGKMFAVSRDILSHYHCVFSFPSLLTGWDPPCLSPVQAAEATFFAHAVCVLEVTCLSLCAAGDRKASVPQQSHPKYIFLLASAAQCVLVGREIRYMWPGKRWGAMDRGLGWKPSPWLRKSCSFLHLCTRGADCWCRARFHWPCWKDGNACLIQIIVPTHKM